MLPIITISFAIHEQSRVILSFVFVGQAGRVRCIVININSAPLKWLTEQKNPFEVCKRAARFNEFGYRKNMIKCNSYNYSLIFSIFDCLSLCLVCHCFCFVLFCFLCPCGGCHGKIIFDCICLCCLTLDAVCVTQYMACHYIVKTGKTLGYWIFLPVKYLSMRFLSFSLLHISGKLLFGTYVVTYNCILSFVNGRAPEPPFEALEASATPLSINSPAQLPPPTSVERKEEHQEEPAHTKKV